MNGTKPYVKVIMRLNEVVTQQNAVPFVDRISKIRKNIYDRNRIDAKIQSTVSLVFGDVVPVISSEFKQVIKSFPDVTIGVNMYELFGDVIARQLTHAAIRVNTSDFMGGGGITNPPSVKCK
ncbi:hypothetical protein DPMN_144969 [Dreissena polymorpha]|uniref:Uncharacterized protein n=1 Tax=Dreissena polymorpha TaxID=45954 RepID=A0A9D4F439_DREPO|nr:hypothetical protein DPMN_144969 [Dreissena polymorpha]